MTSNRQRASNTSCCGRNVAAAMLAGMAISCLYYSYQPAQAEDRTQAPMTVPIRVSELDPALRNMPTLTDGTALESSLVPLPVEEMPEQTLSADIIALNRVIATLEDGISRLQKVPSYTFVFTRQERIDGELRDEQKMEVKLRHAPFSVYMKWLSGDKGRELLFAENENEGRMLVKLGGLKGRFIPTLKLDPMGDRAMSETRHPITCAGLVNLATEIIRNRKLDLEMEETPSCIIEENIMFADRPCIQVTIQHSDPKTSPLYRKAITVIDRELSLPVYVRNYTWPTDTMVDIETESLISCYSFEQIQTESRLAEAVWAGDNPDYRFR